MTATQQEAMVVVQAVLLSKDTCSATPPASVCLSSCGNGLLNPVTEQCDDGGTAGGNGCSSTCTIELGYTCSGTHNQTCVTTCTDGIKAAIENCDDGNLIDTDGCSNSCLKRSDANCALVGNISVCDICGNTVRKTPEICDDGNRLDGQGCSPDCMSVLSTWTCSGGNST